MSFQKFNLNPTPPSPPFLLQRNIEQRRQVHFMTIASKKFFSYIEHEEDTGFVLKDTKTIDIPPLFAQPGNKLQGWNAKNIESYLALLFSLLGAVRGGNVDLSDKTKKLLWFSSKVDYRKFKCAS